MHPTELPFYNSKGGKHTHTAVASALTSVPRSDVCTTAALSTEILASALYPPARIAMFFLATFREKFRRKVTKIASAFLNHIRTYQFV